MLKIRRDQKGISTIELIPILLLFAMLFNFSLGFFGVIHSGILNSIAARNYAFETFRNRPTLTYLRDIPRSGGSSLAPNEQDARYTKDNFRFHGIISEGHGSNKEDWIVTTRALKFTDLKEGTLSTTTAADHNLVRTVADNGKASDVFSGRAPDDGKNGISPVWLKTLYGMCLTAACKPSN